MSNGLLFILTFALKHKEMSEVLDEELRSNEREIYFYFYLNCLQQTFDKKFSIGAYLSSQKKLCSKKEFLPKFRVFSLERLKSYQYLGIKNVISSFESLETRLEYLKIYNTALNLTLEHGLLIWKNRRFILQVILHKLSLRILNIKKCLNKSNEERTHQNLSLLQVNRRLEILWFGLLRKNMVTVRKYKK